jgi:hypothetical protein
MIEKDMTLIMPRIDTMDVQPRGHQLSCQNLIQEHRFIAMIEAAGFRYRICGACGVVRIEDRW